VWSKAKTAIKVATLVDVFDGEGSIDSVKRIEEAEGLEGAVDEAGVIFGVYCVSCKCPRLLILEPNNIFNKRCSLSEGGSYMI
jgi:hypothetical protein